MYFDHRLWALTRGVRLRMAASACVGLVATAAGIARLALLAWLLAKVFRGEAADAMVFAFAGVAGVMVLRGALEYIRTVLAHETAARVQMGLRQRLFDKVVALGPAYFGFERTGDVITTLVDGVEHLETYFGQYIPQLVVSALTPVGIFALVAFLDLPAASVLAGFALFTLFAPIVFKGWDQEGSERRQRAYSAFAADFLDSVQGLATLKSFGQSAARGRILAERAHELFRSTMWVLASNSASRGITDSGIAIGAAATLALGAWRVSAGLMSIEALLVILMLGIEVFRPLRDLRMILHDGMLGQAAAISVTKILDAQPTIRDTEAAHTGPVALAPTVEFEDVVFSYPGGRRPAHDRLSFRAEKGERIGIVGPSGCGKSTVVRLLLRLYDADEGRVLVGGRDVRELSLSALRAQFAVMHQDTYLFHGTVEDNLRFGNPDASRAQLVAAARAANAHSFIEALPQGYDSVIGERGIKLSGGQRQRIAIARAILRDAPILILDEALSSVDADNEAVILAALDRLMEGRTTLIFAHRLSSVIGADRILVLDDGRIAESGTHAELMARRGGYWRLMADQAAHVDDLAEPNLDGVTAQAVAERAPDLPGYDEAIQMEPTDAILRADGMGWMGAIRELMRMVAAWKARLIATFVLGIGRVIALIGVGALSALVVAALKTGAAYESLLVGLAIVAPMAGVLHWFESWLAHDMAFRLLAEMRIALYRKLDELAPSYLLRRRTGDLVAMATGDVERVEYFFAHTIAPAFVAVLVPAAVALALIIFGWPMALALAPFLVLVGISPFALRNRIDRLGSRAREGLGELNAHSADTVQGLVEIVAFQREGMRAAEFAEGVRRHHALRLPFFRDLAMQTTLLEVATGLGGLAVIIAGAQLVEAGALERAVLPLLTLLAMSAFLPISEIAFVGRQLADTLGATRRLYAVQGERVDVTDGPGVSISRAPGDDALAMEGVSFAYFGAKRRALDDVSFSVPSGATVAIVGPSGAGKTTCAHMFMRFWDPDAGAVTMNGADLRGYRLEDLRREIALVTQDTYLFNATLEHNILIARPGASETEVMEALERAALAEFVAELPEGLETGVGERGVRLSGGQRQRVAIARAFLKDAPILILDEATSHLDAVNELLVHQALEELMAHRTTMIIAHRLSTVRSADKIVVLNEGRLVEAGSHAKLLAAGGAYARLVARQLASAVDPAAE